MKTCSICKKNLSLDCFNQQKRRNGQYYPMGACKACHAKRVRAHTAKNMEWLLDQKRVPCVDCGRTDLPPEVMDFDHIRGPKRKFSDLRNSRAALEVEVAKCEVRCPTCHRMRHYQIAMRYPEVGWRGPRHHEGEIFLTATGTATIGTTVIRRRK